MSFDGIFTHLMVQELKAELTAGRLSKVHQPYENELMLVFRSNRKNQTLLLSAHPSYARVQLTNMTYQNPATPPNFCMTVRKHLEGSLLKDIKQVQNDRIINFYFESRNDLGDLEDIVLTVELMGRHSNIMLVNQETNRIIDAIKHVGISLNSFRTILPGSEYLTPPLQDKQNPWHLESEDIFKELNSATEINTSFIQETFEGFGKDTAEELAYRFNHLKEDKLSTWNSFFTELTTPAPTIGLIKNKEFFSPIPFMIYEDTVQSFDSLSQLLDGFYGGKAEKDRVKQQAGELIRKVKNDLAKLKKKTKKLEQSLVDADNAEIYRIKGELLTTFLHDVPRGVTEVTLNNYYEEDRPITIALNKTLTPNQNAQKYFQRYQKLKNGVSSVKEQLEKTKYEQIYLESVLSQLDIATPQDIEVIREELVAERYIKIRSKQKKKTKKVQQSKPNQYESSDGDIIFVGKNNLQNDQLTLKSSSKTDIWLHAKDIPGSHVVIKNSHPSEATLYEAALLAAYHSKYRLSSSVPVDYVPIKHVKKPNGAKPGYVIYDNQKTLFVTPSEEEISHIKKIR